MSKIPAYLVQSKYTFVAFQFQPDEDWPLGNYISNFSMDDFVEIEKKSQGYEAWLLDCLGEEMEGPFFLQEGSWIALTWHTEEEDDDYTWHVFDTTADFDQKFNIVGLVPS